MSTPSTSSLVQSAARLAAVAYDLANLYPHGEYARLNILTHEYASTADREAEVAA